MIDAAAVISAGSSSIHDRFELIVPNDSPITAIELTKKLGIILDRDLIITDGTAAARLLGIEPTLIDRALGETVAWYRKRGSGGASIAA